MKIFEDLFYKSSVKLYRRVFGGGYTDTEKKEFVKDILCDIQPYSAKLNELPYGFDKNITLKMYCKSDDDIKEGDYIVFDNESYIITACIKRELGNIIYLSRRDI